MGNKRKLHFMKMQGCGNDYIYFDCFDQKIEAPEALARRLADRHFGIGGDGIVLICPSKVADARMRMFNADGSEGKMCGNAIRCVGKYLHDVRKLEKKTLTVETRSGIKTLGLITENGVAVGAEVDMGKAELSPEKIPVTLLENRIVNKEVMVGGKAYRITCVSMGNPHCVVFCDDPDCILLPEIGPLFEKHPIFPERVNTEFVKVVSERQLQMRVWERGSGETLACGTGACAAVVAAVENGFCPRQTSIAVSLRGGQLSICYRDDGRVQMAGSAEIVFEGTVEV